MQDETRQKTTEARLREVGIDPTEQRVFTPEDVQLVREILLRDTQGEEPTIEIPDDLDAEDEAQIAEIETEYEHDVDTIRHDVLHVRAGVLTGVLGSVQQTMEHGFTHVPGLRWTAELVDLHTVENVMEFTLELAPFVGAAYAVTGYRLDVRVHPQTKDRTLALEKISWTERGIYLAGELFVSGHLLRGVAKKILKQGAKKVAIHIARETGKKAATNLVQRARRGVEKKKRVAIKKITG